MADLSQRHLAECAHQAALPFGRQRLPDRTGRPLAHRVIQASAQPRVALGDRVSGIRRILSNYQRCLLWDLEGIFSELKVRLPGERLILRSHRVDLVEQELYAWC
jgi:hypothetical protein